MVQFVVAFDCDHCGERFDTLNGAVIHERTHEKASHVETATMTEPIDSEHEQDTINEEYKKSTALLLNSLISSEIDVNESMVKKETLSHGVKKGTPSTTSRTKGGSRVVMKSGNAAKLNEAIKKLKKKQNAIGKKAFNVSLSQVAASDNLLKLSLVNATDVKPKARGSNQAFECNVCGKKFTRYGALWSHRKGHSEKTHDCTDCNYKTKFKSNLYRHRRSYHKDIDATSASMQVSQSGSTDNESLDDDGELVMDLLPNENEFYTIGT